MTLCRARAGVYTHARTSVHRYACGTRDRASCRAACWHPRCLQRTARKVKMHLLLRPFILGLVVGGAQPATVGPTEVAREVRKHLMSMPYYGPFDLITFKVDTTDVV